MLHKSVQQLLAPKSFLKICLSTTTKLSTAIIIKQLNLPAKQHFTLGQEFLQGKFVDRHATYKKNNNFLNYSTTSTMSFRTCIELNATIYI